MEAVRPSQFVFTLPSPGRFGAVSAGVFHDGRSGFYRHVIDGRAGGGECTSIRAAVAVLRRAIRE